MFKNKLGLRLISAAAVLALMLGSVSMALAAYSGTVSTITGTIDATDSLMTPQATGYASCTPVITGSSVFHYEMMPFYVTSTGSYGYYDLRGGLTPLDISVGVYSVSAVDLSNPSANCLEVLDDGFGYTDFFNLTENTQYYFAVRNFSSGETGKYSFSLTGPGRVKLGVVHSAVNADNGDDIVRVVPAHDGSGKAAVQFWCIDPVSGNGSLGGTLTEAVLAKFPTNPATNTLILEVACHFPVKVYRLTTGELQINIGPNQDGKVTVLVFNDLSFTGLTFSDLFQ